MDMLKNWWVLVIIILATTLMLFNLDNVDFDANEDIYTYDTVGYLRRDPYTVPRHHLKKAHYPAAPHPFLYQLIQAEIFKIAGFYLFSARLLSAGLTLLTGLLILIWGKIIFKQNIPTYIGGFIFFMTPLVIRFGRMVNLDVLLMFLQTLGMLWLWFALRRKNLSGLIFSGFTGIAAGLTLATKLSGLLFLPVYIFLFIYYFIKTGERQYLFKLSVFLMVAAGVFILLIDPYSYYYGWTHFPPPKHANITFLTIIRGLTDFKYWLMFAESLIGIPLTFMILFCFIKYRKSWFSGTGIFFLIWILPLFLSLIISPIHITGLSVEWAYLPLMPPIALMSSYGVYYLLRKYHEKKYFLPVIICILIFQMSSVWNYGLRYKPLPIYFRHTTNFRNLINGDITILNIVKILNHETKNRLILLSLKSAIVPLWMLNNNLHTEPFYSQIKNYNFLITDDENLKRLFDDNGFMVIFNGQNTGEKEIFLLKNSLEI